MSGAGVRVRGILALRVSTGGRVERLRVYGYADRNDARVLVEVCVADLSEHSWDLIAESASAGARFIDPYPTPLQNEQAGRLTNETPDPTVGGYLWMADVDLLGVPAIPPITTGRQGVPINARAKHGGSSPWSGIWKVTELVPKPEFDTGVLFVHGIGVQRRAETLSEWSAPLLRWINAWLSGATDAIARELKGEALEQWKTGLTATEPEGMDEDWLDRDAYTKALLRKAAAPSYGQWRTTNKARMQASTESSARTQKPLTAEERHGCKQMVCKLKEEMQAAAVGGGAEFREAYVLDVGLRAAEPSSVEMHLEAMASDGHMLRSRWMLAESHWGESFWAPSFFRFARWCLLTAPIVLVHYIKLSKLQHKSLLRWIASVIGLSVAITLGQLAFVALMLLWLVPWERVRAYVLRVQLDLAGVVGDSYILLEDPVQRRAILDRVQRDLNWLAQRCRSVVVIAHSQGAAVAELVLSNRDEEGAGKIESLVTLGAGIQTLSAIEKYIRSRNANLAGWLAIGSTLLLLAAGVVAIAGMWPFASLLAVVGLGGQAWAAKRADRAHEGRPGKLPRAAQFRPWLDFYAAKDLVPFGPYLDPDNEKKHYVRKEVGNRSSLLADHVTYWENPEQVVGPIARQVGRSASFKPLTELLPDDDATLARLDRARISRLCFLRIARAVLTLSTALLIAAQWWALSEIGAWALDWLRSKLGGADKVGPRPGLGIWLHAAVILLPFIVHKTLVNSTFDAWTTAEVERLLRRSAGAPAMHWVLIFTLLLAITLAAALYYAWLIYLGPIEPWIAGAATVVGAALLARIARGIHHKGVTG